MEKAWLAQKVFTGEEWLEETAVIVKEGIVQQLLPITELPQSMEVAVLEDRLIAPAFIDAQVYGAGGKLFSLYPEAATLHLMSEIFSRQGTLLFQPTVATNSLEVFKSCIDAVRQYWEEGGRNVQGLHLEGPWINAVKRGAHLEAFIHAPTLEETKALLEYGRGVITMITLAPEVCNSEVVDAILQEGVLLSAGHSNAGYHEAVQAFDAGIATVTHLFNAMSPLHHREGGMVGAAFRHKSVMASIIPDGHHVSWEIVALAREVMKERLFVITDAVTQTEEGPYRHQLAGDKYECNGTLSGSSLGMHAAFSNLVAHCGVEVEEALRMCSLYPARALGIDYQYGKIAPLYAGQFVVMDKQLKLVGAISGQNEV